MAKNAILKILQKLFRRQNADHMRADLLLKMKVISSVAKNLIWANSLVTFPNTVVSIYPKENFSN